MPCQHSSSSRTKSSRSKTIQLNKSTIDSGWKCEICSTPNLSTSEKCTQCGQINDPKLVEKILDAFEDDDFDVEDEPPTKRCLLLMSWKIFKLLQKTCKWRRAPHHMNLPPHKCPFQEII
eukprot:scaffold40737_cov42-Cyclotella_meneghiniana.AAC.2